MSIVPTNGCDYANALSVTLDASCCKIEFSDHVLKLTATFFLRGDDTGATSTCPPTAALYSTREFLISRNFSSATNSLACATECPKTRQSSGRSRLCKNTGRRCTPGQAPTTNVFFRITMATFMA